MQEVSMAAWRQSILIKAVTRALRFAFGVGARVMFRPRASAPRPCAEGGRARLPVLAAAYVDAAW